MEIRSNNLHTSKIVAPASSHSLAQYRFDHHASSTVSSKKSGGYSCIGRIYDAIISILKSICGLIFFCCKKEKPPITRKPADASTAGKKASAKDLTPETSVLSPSSSQDAETRKAAFEFLDEFIKNPGGYILDHKKFVTAVNPTGENDVSRWEIPMPTAPAECDSFKKQWSKCCLGFLFAMENNKNVIFNYNNKKFTITTEMIEYVLSKTPDLITTLKRGKHPSLFVSSAHTVAALKAIDSELLSRPDKSSSTPLHQAALDNKVEVVRALIANKVNVEAVDNTGATALHKAQSREVASLLLKASPQLLDSLDNSKNSPLHFAAEKNNTEMVTFLVEQKADVRVVNKKGMIPLHLCCDNETIADLMLKADPTLVSFKDAVGNTPLCYAKTPAFAALLIDKYHADLEVTNNQGETPLAVILGKKKPEVAKVLIERGASIEIEINGQNLLSFLIPRYDTKEWQPVLECAISSNKLDLKSFKNFKKHPLIQILENARTPIGRTAYLKLFGLLVSAGADITIFEWNEIFEKESWWPQVQAILTAHKTQET